MSRKNKNNFDNLDIDAYNKYRVKAIYTYMFYMILLSRFKWENAPLYIPKGEFERAFLKHGMVVFFKDTLNNIYYILPCSNNGERDVYGNPYSVTAYGRNGENFEINTLNHQLPEELRVEAQYDGIVCFDNVLKTPSSTVIDQYSEELANLHVTRNVNVAQQRKPIVITAPEERTQDMLNTYNAMSTNQPVIFGYKQDPAMQTEVKVMDIGGSFIAEDLTRIKKLIINECLFVLGVNHNSVEKKERLVTDEVDNDNSAVNIIDNGYSEPRTHFVNQINEYFDLDIELKQGDIDIDDYIDKYGKDGVKNE